LLPARQWLPSHRCDRTAAGLDTFPRETLKWWSAMPMINEASDRKGPMDIRNVTNHANVERSNDRTKRAEAQRTVIIPSVGRDEASISSAGRETAAAVEGLAERARRGDRDRDQVVARAMQKLISGELDGSDAIGATAQRLLDARFLSA
jgi:hypothetical protein